MDKSAKQRKWPRVLLLLLIVAVLAYGVIFAMVYHQTFVSYPDQHADAVIVLGARVMPEGYLSTTLKNRVTTALTAYQKGLVGKIIVCGAQGADEPTTEAQAMAQYLIEQNVDPDDIYLDDQSTDTIQNVANAKAIMEEHGLTSALLVTSDYHMTRAIWVAEDAGIEVSARPAPGPDTRKPKTLGWLRETLRWINYWVRYRIL